MAVVFPAAVADAAAVAGVVAADAVAAVAAAALETSAAGIRVSVYNFTATLTARNALNHVNLRGANPGVFGIPLLRRVDCAEQRRRSDFGGNNGAAGNRKVEIQLRFQF